MWHGLGVNRHEDSVGATATLAVLPHDGKLTVFGKAGPLDFALRTEWHHSLSSEQAEPMSRSFIKFAMAACLSLLTNKSASSIMGPGGSKDFTYFTCSARVALKVS